MSREGYPGAADLDAQITALQASYQTGDVERIVHELHQLPPDSVHEHLTQLKDLSLRLQLADLFESGTQQLVELGVNRPGFMRPSRDFNGPTARRRASNRAIRYAHRIGEYASDFKHEYEDAFNDAAANRFDADIIAGGLHDEAIQDRVLHLLLETTTEMGTRHNVRWIRQNADMIVGAIDNNMTDFAAELVSLADLFRRQSPSAAANTAIGATRSGEYMFSTVDDYLLQAYDGLLPPVEQAEPESLEPEQEAVGEPISRFREEYYFLSNMSEVEGGIVLEDGRIVPTVEHAYQAAKFTDRNAQDMVLSAADGKVAKNFAHDLINTRHHVRIDWGEQKVNIMRYFVYQKFAQHPDLAARLLATGNRPLVEGNHWGDNFWGDSPEGSGKGQNWMGRILMETRDQLRAAQAKTEA